MNRGANPEGAYRYGAVQKTARAFSHKELSEFETLLFYGLPALRGLETTQTISIGFEPPSGGHAGGTHADGMHTIFIPASSFLETGGTTVTYSGEEIPHDPILEPHKKIDLGETLRKMVERVKDVRKNDSSDPGKKA